MHNNNGNRQTRYFSDLQQFHKLVFQRGYGQRRQKEKGNTCVWNDKKRREKKKTTDEQMYQQKDIKRERMRGKKDKLKSFLFKR